jgi:hypothetical protein
MYIVQAFFIKELWKMMKTLIWDRKAEGELGCI